MKDQINLDLIPRYLSEECSSKEKQIIEQWLTADPANKKTFLEIKRIWDIQPRKVLEQDLRIPWNRLESKMELHKKNQSSGIPDVARHKKPKRLNRSDRIYGSATIWLRMAAVFVVVALSGLIGILYLGEYERTDMLVMNDVITEGGQRAELTLNDGSRVRLNADSKLTHPEEFRTDERIVYLTGEAFFEVIPDGRPFYVMAGDLVVQILGTKFNVHAYEYEPVHVVVAQGKVSVRHHEAVDDEAEILERGSMATLRQDGSGLLSVESDVELQRFLGWLEHRLEFDATPLDKVIMKLERSYGIDIELTEPSLRDLRFTAEFENETIYEILEVIQFSLDLEYTREGRHVRFTQTN